MAEPLRHHLEAIVCTSCDAAHGHCPTCAEPWTLPIRGRTLPAACWSYCVGCGAVLHVEAFAPALPEPLQALERALALPPALRSISPYQPAGVVTRALLQRVRPDLRVRLTKGVRRYEKPSVGRLVLHAHHDHQWPLLSRRDELRAALGPEWTVAVVAAPPAPAPRPKPGKGGHAQPCPATAERRTLAGWRSAGVRVKVAPASVAACYVRTFGRSPIKVRQSCAYSRRELQLVTGID